jgi:cobalt/nickel transport system permease protein
MPPLWAVHIADVLGMPWVVAGWIIAGLLATVAARRVREEEIPRIALLTAAFFVASSIHVKLGVTSVHLLLNGLVGVILGRRAPLAILIGVTLQALLLAHGGVTTIGVNASVQAIPALACWGLFRLLRGWVGGAAWRRLLVIALGASAWGACLLLGVVALVANPWHNLVRVSASAGLVVSLDSLDKTLRLALHPISLGILVAFVEGCVIVAWRRRTSAEFAIGALVGLVGVLGTLLLLGGVLVSNGEDWGTFVNVIFLIHLPLALLEAGIVGLMVGFLARVQPELLGAGVPARAGLGAASLLALLLMPTAAWAHRMDAEARVDVQKQEVAVECWYETGDAPTSATARVTRPDGSVLAEGPIDAKGVFRFGYDEAEDLRVEITAPGGHRAVVRLSAKQLGAAQPENAAMPARSHEERGTRWGDLLAGVGFVLASAAFWLGLRNARTLRRLEDKAERGTVWPRREAEREGFAAKRGLGREE